MSAAESTPSTPVPPPPTGLRRGPLLLSACTLLAIGAGVNVHRYVGLAEAPLELDRVQHSERQLAHRLEPADGSALTEAKAEAGGSGQRHKGEEGRMGTPTSKQKSGLYAMRGPSNAVPQLARSYDPALGARNAGILGMMTQESGHFLASPYGAAFAVGSSDADVWGGLQADARSGRSLVFDPASYRSWFEAAFTPVDRDPRSTFSIDVDTGSYTLARRSLTEGALPAPGSIRVEEMINYFDYDYPEPRGEVPVSITSEVGPCPWNPEHRLVHLGVQGKHVATTAVPPRNLVFLIDVSGSMSGELPLVVSSLAYLTEQLGADDRISIVVYAGAAGTVLPPTAGTDKARILGALERLEAGGSTNGGEGIHLAYGLAEQHFVEGGINRVILATDGDFNVGVVGENALVELIGAKRRSGVFLSVLGYGSSNFQDRAMEQLADEGNGNYAYIDGLAEARRVLVEQAGATLQTIAKDVKIQVLFEPDAVEQYRLVGYANRVLAHRDFADDTKDAGEIGAGHTVTALYEVVPAAEPSGGPLMELKLRYKQPDADRSEQVMVPVHDRGAELSDTTDDFRFSAAVAGFGQALEGLPTPSERASLPALRDLARDARGADRHCRRAELVSLVERASALQGQALTASGIQCVPTEGPGPVTYAEPLVPVEEHEGDEEQDQVRSGSSSGSSDEAPFDWKRFVVEVLYLLPPLLAMPLFVMALRRPRRRRD